MKWGYDWDLGPFETWDALVTGNQATAFAEIAKRMKQTRRAAARGSTRCSRRTRVGFYKDDRVWRPEARRLRTRATDPREVTWEVLRQGSAPVLKNTGAEAWDLGDGVLGLTFKTKANSIDADVIKMIHQSVERAERDFRAMVVWNQGEFFCVGANVFAVVMAAEQKQWDGLRELVHGYQYATQRMKYATVPVVAAPYGMTLGGGLELCMGAAAVQAAAETYAGLVEVGVGLIPGGGGTMNMLWRALEAVPEGVDIDTYAFVTQVFKNIALAKVATSARGGQGVRLLPPHRRRVVRSRAPAVGGQAARARAGRGRLPPADRRAPTSCPARAASRRCR